MIAIPKQYPIDVSLSGDEVWISQTDIDGQEATIAVAKSNVPALIAALQDALKV